MSNEPADTTPGETGKRGREKWWYNLAVFVIICVFLLALDFMTSGSISCSFSPIAALLSFGIASSPPNKSGMV